MTVIAAIGLIVLGVLVLWFVKWLEIDLGDVSKAAILILPTIVYLLVSGSIQEITAFGWKAQFKAISEDPVDRAASAADLLISIKELNDPRFNLEAVSRECRPYFAVKVGTFSSADVKPEDRQRIIEAARSVRYSLLCGSFRGLVVIDERAHPLGIVKASALMELVAIRLEAPNSILATGTTILSQKPFEEVITTQFGRTLTDPSFQASTDLSEVVIVNEKLSIGDTYKLLVSEDADVGLIVDNKGHFRGIIGTRDIEEWTMQQLLKVNPLDQS